MEAFTIFSNSRRWRLIEAFLASRKCMTGLKNDINATVTEIIGNK
jgi:hypothetical protein